MNTKRLLIASLLLAILLSACGASATPTQIAQYAPTSAPYPTQAPPLAVYPTASAPTQAPYATPAPTAPADMFFENYGVNPFVDTYEDHLSTFALDVDTASYSLAGTARAGTPASASMARAP